jgi:hypothetical protein
MFILICDREGEGVVLNIILRSSIFQLVHEVFQMYVIIYLIQYFRGFKSIITLFKGFTYLIGLPLYSLFYQK